MWNHDGETMTVWPGRNYPLGATWSHEATNFAVYAPRRERAVGVPVRRRRHRGAAPAHRALARRVARRHPGRLARPRSTATAPTARGTPTPACGSTPTKLLLDPYGKAVSGDLVADDAIFGYTVGEPETTSDLDSAPYVPRSVVVYDDFQWGADTSPRRRWRDTVIYELHVKGMTQLHDRVPEELRGTYAGLASARGDRLPQRPRRHGRRAAARSTSSSPSRRSPSVGW